MNISPLASLAFGSRKSCAQLLREPSVCYAKYSFCAQKLLRETLFMPVLSFTGIKKKYWVKLIGAKAVTDNFPKIH